MATYDPFSVSVERPENQEGSKSCQTSPTVAESEPIKCKHTAKSENLATGAKKKLPPATLSKKPRLEERGNVSKDPSCVRSEANMIHKENRKEQRKLILKKDSKGKRKLIVISVLSHPSDSSRKFKFIKPTASLPQLKS